jgi:hypothetical protein
LGVKGGCKVVGNTYEQLFERVMGVYMRCRLCHGIVENQQEKFGLLNIYSILDKSMSDRSYPTGNVLRDNLEDG